MNENTEKIMNSELAYKILRELNKAEERNPEGEIKGKYVEEIADSIGSTGNSVTNYLKVLRELNLVKRGKRTFRQYYQINYPGIYILWVNRIQEELDKIKEDLKTSEERKKEIKKHLKEREGTLLVEKIAEITGEESTGFSDGTYTYIVAQELTMKKEEVYAFIKNYVKRYMSQVEVSNLFKMLIEDFEDGLRKISKFNYSSDIFVLHEVFPTVYAFFKDSNADIGEIVTEASEETLTMPDFPDKPEQRGGKEYSAVETWEIFEERLKKKEGED